MAGTRRTQITYGEEPQRADMIEAIRARASWTRGRKISQAEVLRWLVRRALGQVSLVEQNSGPGALDHEI